MAQAEVRCVSTHAERIVQSTAQDTYPLCNNLCILDDNGSGRGTTDYQNFCALRTDGKLMIPTSEQLRTRLFRSVDDQPLYLQDSP